MVKDVYGQEVSIHKKDNKEALEKWYEEYCDWSDLRRRDCDHCVNPYGEEEENRPRTNTRRADAEGWSHTAEFGGRCAGQPCVSGGEITPGEVIAHTADGWAHEECV